MSFNQCTDCDNNATDFLFLDGKNYCLTCGPKHIVEYRLSNIDEALKEHQESTGAYVPLQPGKIKVDQQKIFEMRNNKKKPQEVLKDLTPEEMAVPEHAQHYSFGKTPLEMVSFIALLEVAQVFAFGASKYDKNNWRQGMPYSELVNSALRHTLAFLLGEKINAESGLSHLAHASWNLMALQEYEYTHPEMNDLYKFDKTTIEILTKLFVYEIKNKS